MLSDLLDAAPGAGYHLLSITASLLALSVATVVIYRLYFSPLASIPGPQIAAATSLFHFYHDVIRDGQYIWVVRQMHEKYGPVVRIRPDAIHVNDPQAIDAVFGTVGSRRNKAQGTLNGYMAYGSVLGTEGHDLHRRRRAALSPFFSKQSVRKLEGSLKGIMRKVARRLRERAAQGGIVNMNVLYASMTSDIVTGYALGESWGYLDMPDLNERAYRVISASCSTFHLNTFVPVLGVIVRRFPRSIIMRLIDITFFEKMVLNVSQRLEIIRRSIVEQGSPAPGSAVDVSDNIFYKMITSDQLPAAEKTTKRLIDEARIVIAAGTDTTAQALKGITYELLANPAVLAKLKKELEHAIPLPHEGEDQELPSVADLEELPYLSAVIEEGLRLYAGFSYRQERVSPDEDTVIHTTLDGKPVSYIIPAGTSVSMTAPLLHRHEDLYGPNPDVFDPERYLNNKQLSKYLITFSRGPRQCVGINLAYAEMYLALSTIFRCFDLYDGTGTQRVPTMELYETSREDVAMVRDRVAPFVKTGSLGVRVKLRLPGTNSE
ncbi:cytochrome P450 [Aspergillus sclerotiicarbonarius CBS 121057]|uniref:Cytochrome P450 n=1 Tax=Aspergillus sclerotiicarbonarius (strain CBS 121057 / IBT 28362) TaxID=1448318 RepID=A0A319F8L7_ASPSB|nr:cytochrome P450 [Aspergillus sclerotiicarbonarius CBS 121057]